MTQNAVKTPNSPPPPTECMISGPDGQLTSVLWANRVGRFHDYWKRGLLASSVVGLLTVVLTPLLPFWTCWLVLPMYTIMGTQLVVTLTTHRCPLRELEDGLRYDGIPPGRVKKLCRNMVFSFLAGMIFGAFLLTGFYLPKVLLNVPK